MKLFTIHDSKADFYHQPFFARTAGEAIRTFTQLVNSNPEQNQISAHPADFTLFEIAEFDEDTGLITGSWADKTDSEYKKSLGNGIDYKQQIN